MGRQSRLVLLLLIVSNLSNLNTLIPKIGLRFSKIIPEIGLRDSKYNFSPTTKSYGKHFKT